MDLRLLGALRVRVLQAARTHPLEGRQRTRHSTARGARSADATKPLRTFLDPADDATEDKPLPLASEEMPLTTTAATRHREVLPAAETSRDRSS